jgi:predicted RNA-binding protein
MCESDVYIRENEKEKKVMEDVSVVKVEGDKIIIQKIFGSSGVFDNYKIDTINFLNHKVVIKPKQK